MRTTLAMVCLLVGCRTTIRATQVNPAPHAMRPRPPASVAVFTSGAPQNVRFVDVALFEAEQRSAYSTDDTQDFIAQLRQRAATMGCDGLVIGGITNATTTTIDDVTPPTKKGLTATCIMYLEPCEAVAATSTAGTP